MKKVLLTAITLTCLLVGSSSVMACGSTSTPNDQGKEAYVTWKIEKFESEKKAYDVDSSWNKTREIEEESPMEEETG